jgi:hypothetical protein
MCELPIGIRKQRRMRTAEGRDRKGIIEKEDKGAKWIKGRKNV